MKFKIGDKVIIDKNKSTFYDGEIFNWYSKKEFTIIKITNNVDPFNYPIVQLNENIVEDENFNHLGYISTYYLSKNLKDERKQKLIKINNVN